MKLSKILYKIRKNTEVIYPLALSLALHIGVASFATYGSFLYNSSHHKLAPEEVTSKTVSRSELSQNSTLQNYEERTYIPAKDELERLLAEEGYLEDPNSSRSTIPSLDNEIDEYFNLEELIKNTKIEKVELELEEEEEKILPLMTMSKPFEDEYDYGFIDNLSEKFYEKITEDLKDNKLDSELYEIFITAEYIDLCKRLYRDGRQPSFSVDEAIEEYKKRMATLYELNMRDKGKPLENIVKAVDSQTKKLPKKESTGTLIESIFYDTTTQKGAELHMIVTLQHLYPDQTLKKRTRYEETPEGNVVKKTQIVMDTPESEETTLIDPTGEKKVKRVPKISMDETDYFWHDWDDFFLGYGIDFNDLLNPKEKSSWNAPSSGILPENSTTKNKKDILTHLTDDKDKKSITIDEVKDKLKATLKEYAIIDNGVVPRIQKTEAIHSYGALENTLLNENIGFGAQFPHGTSLVKFSSFDTLQYYLRFLDEASRRIPNRDSENERPLLRKDISAKLIFDFTPEKEETIFKLDFPDGNYSRIYDDIYNGELRVFNLTSPRELEVEKLLRRKGTSSRRLALNTIQGFFPENVKKEHHLSRKEKTLDEFLTTSYHSKSSWDKFSKRKLEEREITKYKITEYSEIEQLVVDTIEFRDERIGVLGILRAIKKGYLVVTGSEFYTLLHKIDRTVVTEENRSILYHGLDEILDMSKLQDCLLKKEPAMLLSTIQFLSEKINSIYPDSPQKTKYFPKEPIKYEELEELVMKFSKEGIPKNKDRFKDISAEENALICLRSKYLALALEGLRLEGKLDKKNLHININAQLYIYVNSFNHQASEYDYGLAAASLLGFSGNSQYTFLSASFNNLLLNYKSDADVLLLDLSRRLYSEKSFMFKLGEKAKGYLGAFRYGLNRDGNIDSSMRSLNLITSYAQLSYAIGNEDKAMEILKITANTFRETLLYRNNGYLFDEDKKSVWGYTAMHRFLSTYDFISRKSGEFSPFINRGRHEKTEESNTSFFLDRFSMDQWTRAIEQIPNYENSQSYLNILLSNALHPLLEEALEQEVEVSSSIMDPPFSSKDLADYPNRIMNNDLSLGEKRKLIQTFLKYKTFPKEIAPYVTDIAFDCYWTEQDELKKEDFKKKTKEDIINDLDKGRFVGTMFLYRTEKIYLFEDGEQKLYFTDQKDPFLQWLPLDF